MNIRHLSPAATFLALSLLAGNPLNAAELTLSSGWTLQDVAKVEKTATTPAEQKAEADVWGAKLSLPSATLPGAYKATVPGTVLTSLVNNKVYPEPLFGENNRPDKIPESLCRTSYWYRTDLAVPADFAGQRIWLNFEGINYTADVWVNGKHAGTVRGAFARGIFDVTDFVKAGQPAAIAVRINPPPHPGTPQEQTVANGTGPNGGALMQDGPTFGCTVGWDWIPAIRDRDMGLWQKVTLSTSGPVRVDDPAVSSRLPLPKTDSADLMVLTTLRNATDQPQSGNLKGTFDGGSFSVPVTLQPHEVKEVQVTAAQAPGLHVTNPKLWWPNTYGDPHLYNMSVTFDIAGKLSDAKNTSFGIREITYAATADQSLIPPSQNLTLFVNGIPIMCKGGCWGMDEAMKRIPADVLDAKVRFHKEANCTMIRNWVGQSTSEDFYRACDKYGILVWDEMFQANASDGPQVGGNPNANDTPETLAWRADVIQMYKENVREKVVRFRGHPAIAIWCGRNESNPAPAEIATYLTAITSQLDPARLFHANSNEGSGVRSGGPYGWRVPSAYFGPVTVATTASAPARGFGRGGGGALEPFKTELGSVSIPTLASIKAMLPEKDWYDLNDDWASHDLCNGAQTNQGGGNAFPLQVSARYGAIAPRDLADFTRKSQLACYESYRAMYEGRMARLFAPCAGVLTWMSNPSQPSFVWQLYSYELEPLAALYGTKKACEPLHIQLNQHDWHVMLVNTQPKAAENLSARVRLFNMDGTPKGEKTFPVTAKACAATDLGIPDWPAGLSPVHFVKLELTDAAGKLLSDNFYWRTTATLAPAAAPLGTDTFGAGGIQQGRGGRAGRGTPAGAPVEDFSAMQSLPTATLQVALTRNELRIESGNLVPPLFQAVVTNPTTIPALLIHLQLRKKNGDRILPVFYSDNFFSLLPNESKTISIEATSWNAAGETPDLALDGYNVSVTPSTTPAGTVSLNQDAFVGPKQIAPATLPN